MNKLIYIFFLIGILVFELSANSLILKPVQKSSGTSISTSRTSSSTSSSKQNQSKTSNSTFKHLVFSTYTGSTNNGTAIFDTHTISNVKTNYREKVNGKVIGHCSKHDFYKVFLQNTGKGYFNNSTLTNSDNYLYINKNDTPTLIINKTINSRKKGYSVYYREPACILGSISKDDFAKLNHQFNQTFATEETSTKKISIPSALFLWK